MNLGLRIFIKGGQFLAVFMPRDSALAFIKNWSQGRYDSSETLEGTCTSSGCVWAVKVSEIAGMHTYMVMSEQTPSTSRPFMGGSN